MFAGIKRFQRLSHTRNEVEDALRRASIFTGGALDPDKVATSLTHEMQSVWAECYSGKLPGGLPNALSGAVAALALGLRPTLAISDEARAQVFMAMRSVQDTITANQHTMGLGPVDAFLMNSADKLYLAYLDQVGPNSAVEAA